MPKLIAKMLPTFLKEPIEFQYNRLKYFGFKRYCPACKSWVRGFIPFGRKPREDAQCPICKLVERHRALWVLLERELGIKKCANARILHFAPEKRLTKFFKSIKGAEYLSADLSSESAMVNFDVTEIPYPDSSFDIVYCSHVLERVPDDRKALNELCRVVSENGKVIIMVPIHRETTYEDFSITSPEEREKAFGQHDHVRVYGDDFRDRLKEASFEFREYHPSDYMTDMEIVRYGLHRLDAKNQLIFVCSRVK